MIGLLFAVAALSAPRFELSAPAYLVEGYELCLPSDMRVVIERDDRVPAVAITTVVGAGAVDDPPGKEGVAHLLEHLALRPTRDAVLDTGGRYNGSTWPEATLYTTLVPMSQFEDALRIEARRMLDPLAGIDEADVAVERQVVANELNWRGEQTDRKAMSAVYQALYPAEHPFHRGFASASDTTDSIDLADVRAFAREHYRPHNMSLHIVGPVDPDAVQQMLQDDFDRELVFEPGPHKGRCPPTRPTAQPQPPPPATNDVQRVKGPTVHRTLYLAWSLPGGFRADDALASMAVDYLESAVASRLHRVRGRTRDEYFGVGCSLFAGVAASTAMCTLQLPDGVNVTEVVQEARKGLSEMEGAGEQVQREFWFARSRMRAFAWTMETAEDRVDPMSFAAETRARHSHFASKETWYEERVEFLSKTNESQLDRFAGKWLTAERSVAVVLEPSGLSAASGAAELVEGEAHELPPLQNIDVVQVVQGLPADAIREETLPSGLRIVAAQFGDVPLSHASMVVNGGRYTGLLHQASLAQFEYKWTSVGMPFHRAALNIGGRFSWWVSRDHSRFEITGASGNIEDQVFVLSTLARSAKLAWPTRGLVDDRARYELQDMFEDPWSWAARYRTHALLGPQLAGDVPNDPFAHWFELSEGDARKWWKGRWHPGNVTIYVVSSEPPGTALTYAKRHFNTWTSGKPAQPQPALVPGDPAPAEVLWFGAKTQRSDVRYSCRIDPATPQTADVLVGWLRGALWRRLRERSGATYTPSVWVERVAGQTVLHQDVTVADELVGHAANTLREAVAEAAGGLSDEAVARGRNRGALGAAIEILSVEDLLDAIIEQDRGPGGLEAAALAGERLAAVDSQAIAEATASCESHGVITVVGATEPTVEGLSVRRVDWFGQTRTLLQRYDPGWLDARDR